MGSSGQTESVKRHNPSSSFNPTNPSSDNDRSNIDKDFSGSAPKYQGTDLQIFPTDERLIDPPTAGPNISGAIAELRQIARQAVGHEVDPEFYELLDRREAVYERLIAYGSEAVAPLVDLLTERNSMISLFAAEALGRLGDSQAVKPLLSAFVSEANPVYTIAVAQIGDTSAVEPLIAILDNADALAEEHAEQIRLRGLAAEGNTLTGWIGKNLYRLGIVQTDRHIRDAQSLLLRRSAAQALEALGDRRAIAPLQRWAEHPEPSLRETVQHALKSLGG